MKKSHRTRSGARLLITCVCMCFFLRPSSAGAASAPESFVTMLSEPGDWIGQGVDRFYHPGNAHIDASGDAAEVMVSVNGGNRDDWFFLDFAAPRGETLEPGEYDHAQRASFREDGRPGINVSGDGRGCNTLGGRFQVNSIAFDPSGDLTSLWVVYEQDCEGSNKTPLFGEVRYNVPGDGGSATIGPRHARWPKADVGEAMKAVPITVANTGAAPVTLEAATISGPDSDDFSISADECHATTLNTNETCQVSVRYSPTAAGERQAHVTIPEVGGSTHTTLLDGFVFAGTTRVLLHSDPGDYIGSGLDYSYTPANTKIGLSGSPEEIRGRIVGSDGDSWHLFFRAPRDESLAAGNTYEVVPQPWNVGGAGMIFYGNGRGCQETTGTFTIYDIFVDQYGDVQRFSAYFKQHCDGDESSPALHGIIDFHADQPTEPGPRSVSVSKMGEGTITSNPDGISCGEDCDHTYTYGTSVSLTATPAPGYQFVGWSGSCAGSDGCLVKATEDRSAAATFAPEPLDTTPPVTTVKLNGADPQDFYDGPVDVTLAATDGADEEATGVAYIEYRLDSDDPGDWEPAENTAGGDPFETTFTVSEPGDHDVDYRSADVAGNVEELQTAAFEIVIVDPAPELSVSVSPKTKVVGPRERRVRFRFHATYVPGPFGDDELKVCARAPRRVKVIGKRCRVASDIFGEATLTRVFKVRPKPAARGRRTRIRFIARESRLGTKRTAVAKLRVRR